MKTSMLFIFTFFLTFGEISLAAPLEKIVFIVNAENPAVEVSVNDIRDYYFKRRRQWPDGTSLRFIDRNAEVDVRKVFLKEVLQQTNEDVEIYWIGQKLYSGNSAPLREPSDSTVVHFVSSFKGSIGYVSSDAVLASKKVKVIKVNAEKKD